MSDTPRTDAALRFPEDDAPHKTSVRLCSLALQLERELAALRADAEPVAWMYSLIIEGEEVEADCSRANWNPKYQPFGRAGIDYAEGGIVIKTPLYAAIDEAMKKECGK